MEQLDSSGDDLLALDKQFCFALYSASLAMTKAYKPLLDALGLTYPQYLAMLVLWQQDGVSVKQIGQQLLLDSGTLTPLLKRLETAGLIVRQRSSSDERSVNIHLTSNGRALKEQAKQIPLQILCASGQTVAQLGQMRSELLLVRDALHSANEQGGYALSVQLVVSLPGISAEQGQALLDKAHQVCPYSNATRGNIPVTLSLA
ncbi:MAG: MarR family transcriptional regulator [Burkholderiales bacterium]|nr:MarR family transcriptional regulator [Burkholderiales bacterium]